MSNEQCNSRAQECIEAGDYRGAMRWFNSAAAKTLGHGKASRYESAARSCARKGGFSYSHEYAAD